MPRGLILLLWMLGAAVIARLWARFKNVATAILLGCLFFSCCTAHEKHRVVFYHPHIYLNVSTVHSRNTEKCLAVWEHSCDTDCWKSCFHARSLPPGKHGFSGNETSQTAMLMLSPAPLPNVGCVPLDICLCFQGNHGLVSAVKQSS